MSTALRTVARVGKFLCYLVSRANKKRSTPIQLGNKLSFSLDVEINAKDLAMAEILVHADVHKNIDVNELSDITRLVLTNIHHKHFHCGKDQTLSLVRQRYWLPRASGSFKTYLRDCAVCKRWQGLPFGSPNMPPLPTDRVVITKPFRNIGCDFIGPFFTKSDENMYICLYTCLTTRAVHLEVVENMSAGAFLNSFIRFVSRRGVPHIVRSDCGANFRLGSKIIIKLSQPADSTGCSVMSYHIWNRSKQTLATEIAKNIYVDNILLVADSEEEVLQKYRDSKELFSKIGMNLREYISNSALVNSKIPAEDRLGKFYVLILIGTGRFFHETSKKWVSKCREIDNTVITIPRVIMPALDSEGGTTAHLWVFADASKIAIAACAYMQSAQNNAVSQIICGKSRLSPKKNEQTIPCLELSRNLDRSQTSETVNIVTDSEVALCWIKSSRKLPVFVSNQCVRIHKLRSQIESENVTVQFFHVPTSYNPADAGTRGLSKEQIISSAWVKGPCWLEALPKSAFYGLSTLFKQRSQSNLTQHR
ncbi:hypothetical protein OSTOST_04935 [Ostertagia ostertagi]